MGTGIIDWEAYDADPRPERPLSFWAGEYDTDEADADEPGPGIIDWEAFDADPRPLRPLSENIIEEEEDDPAPARRGRRVLSSSDWELYTYYEESDIGNEI